MRPRIQTVVLSSDLGAFVDDIRHVFSELGRGFPPDLTATECSPPIDVFETDQAFNVCVDLPGMDASAVRLVAKGDSLLIVGDKIARRAHADSSYHVVERGFGRFARVVHLGRACNPADARATLVDGELRIVLPKIAERRGRRILIPVQATTDVQPA
jgi:HSP20 family protein